MAFGPWWFNAGTTNTGTANTDLPRIAAVAAELDSAVTADASSIPLDTALWTVDPGMYPMLVNLDGEIISAGGASISGTVTLTSVTRSLNNVTKAHSAGAPVQVFDPIRATLGRNSPIQTTAAVIVPDPPDGGGTGGGPGAGGAEAAFNNGAPGDFAPSNIASRETWFGLYDRDYFEPQHNPAGTGPVRQVWVSAAGGGNGLTSSTPTTLANYMAASGITPAAGDQVRIQGAGPHNINSGTERSINGTAANPIRFVRDDAATVPIIQNSAAANSTWPFTDSSYLGFHGLDIDGNYPTYNNIWGLSFGQRFTGDSGMERCHHIDVWHCEIHDQAQNTFTFEGTESGGPGADNRARFCHLFACDIHDSGQNSSNNFSELTYFGSGNDTDDHAHDICIEACDIHDGPSGEGTDLKHENFNTYIVGNKYHTIRCTSQGAIAAFFAADLYYHYNIMWDIDRKSGQQDGCGIWTSSIDADYNLMWDFGITAFVSSRLQRGTMGVVVRHLTAWDMEQTQTLGSGSLHHQNTGTFDEGNLPTIDFDATCISDDGDQGTTNAASSDFVGPALTGDAIGSVGELAGEPGSAFVVDAASSIPETAGALGKE